MQPCCTDRLVTCHQYKIMMPITKIISIRRLEKTGGKSPKKHCPSTSSHRNPKKNQPHPSLVPCQSELWHTKKRKQIKYDGRHGSNINPWKTARSGKAGGITDLMFVCQILNTGQLHYSGTTQPKNVRIQPRCTSTRLNFAKHFQNIIKIGTKQKKGSLPFTVSGLEWLLTEESLTCGLSRRGLNSSRRNQQTEHFTSSSSSRSNLRPPCQEILNCYKSEMMFRNTFTKQFPSRLLLESLSDPLVGQRDQPPKIKEPTVTCLPDWLELLQREFPTNWHDKLAWLSGWEDKWTNHDSPQQK